MRYLFLLTSQHIYRFSSYNRDNAGENIQSNISAAGATQDEQDVVAKPKKSGFSAFAAAGFIDDIPMDDEDDGSAGGLMVGSYIFNLHI